MMRNMKLSLLLIASSFVSGFVFCRSMTNHGKQKGGEPGMGDGAEVMDTEWFRYFWDNNDPPDVGTLLVLEDAEVLFSPRGLPLSVRGVNRERKSDGWTILFAAEPELPNISGARLLPKAAQHFVDGVADGYFLKWDTTLGAGFAPFAFGKWKDGKPDWGKFLVSQEQGIGSSIELTLGADLPPSFSFYRGGERLDYDLGQPEPLSATDVRGDREAMHAISQIRAMFERFSLLRMYDPTRHGDSETNGH